MPSIVMPRLPAGFDRGGAQRFESGAGHGIDCCDAGALGLGGLGLDGVGVGH